MRVEFRKYELGRTLAGKIVMRPESFEEQVELDAFRTHVGNRQTGRKFDVVFRPRKAGPDEIAVALKKVVEE